MNLKKAISLTLSMALSLTVLAGCSSGSSSQAGSTAASSGSGTETFEEVSNINPEMPSVDGATYKSSLVIATTNDLSSYMPYGNSNTQTAMLTNSTFNRLVDISADNEIEPDLALEWEANEDSTVWTFHLRDDVYFHNGEHLTAEDVKFTFEYATSTQNEGINYPIPGGEYIDSITADDDYTVTFHLNRTCADWPFYASQKILSKATIEAEGIEEGGAIGTGPFEFVEYKPGVSWTMRRNDNYFGEKPVTEEITFTVITDDNARALALESGDVDAVFDPAPADVVKFLGDENYNVYQAGSISNIFLGLNYAREACQNDDIRKAIAMAINRDDIVAACFEDGALGNASLNFINSVSPGYVDVDAVPYDVEGAKEILAGLGYDENNKLELRLYAFAKFMSVAEIVQADLAMANIDVTVQEFSTSSFSASLREDGQYDMYLQQSSSQGGLLSIVQRFLTTGGASNVMNYSNAELDQLVEEAASCKTMDEMEDKYAEIQQMVADQVPAVPLVEQYLWCIGTNNFYGIDLNNQYYYVNFTNCCVIE